MTELEFKNTNPTDYGSGNINLLYSSSIGTGSYELPANHYGASGSFAYDKEVQTIVGKEYYLADAIFPPYRILGLTIPFNSANDVSLEQKLSAVTKIRFTIGGTPATVNVIQTAKNAGYYFIRTQPTDVFAFPTDLDTSGTPLDSVVEFIFDPFLVAKFNNSDFNALIGNASTNSTSDVALEVDRSTDPLKPSNLDAIISKTATRASVQYSNYTIAGWTNARYEGTKLTSGSIFGDDPALALKSFKASVHPLDSDVDTILSAGQGDTDTRTLYFNVEQPPRLYQPAGSSIMTRTGPYVIAGTFPIAQNNYYDGNFIFGLEGGKFVRVVDRKIHATDKGSVYVTNEFGRATSEVTSGSSA